LGIFRQKVAQIIWAIFFRKKCAQRQQISPKWRNFAQSGHTADQQNILTASFLESTVVAPFVEKLGKKFFLVSEKKNFSNFGFSRWECKRRLPILSNLISFLKHFAHTIKIQGEFLLDLCIIINCTFEPERRRPVIFVVSKELVSNRKACATHRNLKTSRIMHLCMLDNQIGRESTGLAPADMAGLPHLRNTKN
jgi:hypothetical protein